jgi:RNA polymerase sigma factor (sigma-70 family)
MEGRMPLQDEDLARRAAAGDAAAFATLYDRYERRAYNLCYRITGSPDDAADATQETFLKVLERLPRLRDRDLNFGAYVMTAARNASYDAIERRKRATPTSELPEVPLADDRELPDRAALREAHQEQIRLANESLPARQREVLALRELGELSYGEVAQIMGMNQNSVAQLISRARINLRDGLRQTALGSVASASPQCDRALPLLAMHQDGLLDDPWLVEHLMDCGACRVRLEAMEEAGVAYRQWLLLVPALRLREETAEAAERVNGGWNRRSRVLAGGAATLVLLLALAFVTADGAQSPTRAPAAEEAEPVVHVAADEAAKPPVERRTKKPRSRVKKQKKAPRKVAPAATPSPEPPVSVESEPVVTAQVVATPEPVAPKVRSRPRREPVKTVVVPDPPPAPPEPVDVAVTTTPKPPDRTPGGTTTTPTPQPCQSTSAAGCQPPRPPAVTCRTCTLVAPPPPPRRPLRLVDPNSINRTP